MSVYDNVKKIADENGFSISFVEKEAKLGNGTIGKWRTIPPNLGNVEKVANVLGVEKEVLIK